MKRPCSLLKPTLLISCLIFSGRLCAKDSTLGFPPDFDIPASPGQVWKPGQPTLLPPPEYASGNTMPVVPEVAVIPPPSADTKPFALTLHSKGENYRIGERAQFMVESSQACYLTVVDIGASGNVAVLFPNTYQQANRILAGQKLRIPAPDQPFDIKVSGPAGKERVVAICRLQDTPLFGTAYNFNQYPFRTLTPDWESGLSAVGVGQEVRAETSFMVRK